MHHTVPLALNQKVEDKLYYQIIGVGEGDTSKKMRSPMRLFFHFLVNAREYIPFVAILGGCSITHIPNQSNNHNTQVQCKKQHHKTTIY
jgi:hypothetical protein